MSKAIALTQRAYVAARPKVAAHQADVLSSTITLGCGAALIFAGAALPF